MYELIYLDDVIVFSWTEEEHLTQLLAVFQQFQEHGLKLKLLKCHFAPERNHLLGAQSVQGGYETRRRP